MAGAFVAVVTAVAYVMAVAAVVDAVSDFVDAVIAHLEIVKCEANVYFFRWWGFIELFLVIVIGSELFRKRAC